MVNFKVVVSDPKTAKSQVLELKDATAQPLLGRRIGETIDGTLIGSTGKVKLTGGSDRAGFPMRYDVLGSGKNYVLMTRGVGLTSKTEGMKKRKLVRGGTISEEIYQVNAVWTEGAPALEAPPTEPTKETPPPQK